MMTIDPRMIEISGLVSVLRHVPSKEFEVMDNEGHMVKLDAKAVARDAADALTMGHEAIMQTESAINDLKRRESIYLEACATKNYSLMLEAAEYLLAEGASIPDTLKFTGGNTDGDGTD